MGKWDDGDAEPTSTDFAVLLGIEIYLVTWIIVCQLLAKCSELYLLFGSAPLYSLCRGPVHLVLSLLTALKCRLPKADSKKPSFLSMIIASDLLLIFSLFCLLHMLHCFSVLAQFVPGVSCWSLAALPCPYSKAQSTWL